MLFELERKPQSQSLFNLIYDVFTVMTIIMFIIWFITFGIVNIREEFTKVFIEITIINILMMIVYISLSKMKNKTELF
jgi:hypothetical protein